MRRVFCVPLVGLLYHYRHPGIYLYGFGDTVTRCDNKKDNYRLISINPCSWQLPGVAGRRRFNSDSQCIYSKGSMPSSRMMESIPLDPSFSGTWLSHISPIVKWLRIWMTLYRHVYRRVGTIARSLRGLPDCLRINYKKNRSRKKPNDFLINLAIHPFSQKTGEENINIDGNMMRYIESSPILDEMIESYLFAFAGMLQGSRPSAESRPGLTVPCEILLLL